MTRADIVKFEPDGANNQGLKDWFAIDPAELAAGEPHQRVHLYHEDEKLGYLTGVWDCTPMTEHFGPYPVHEFMILLEGSLTFNLSNDRQVSINSSEPFIIPKGLPCQWIQTGYVRKFFMIFEDPGADPAVDVAAQTIIKPSLTGSIGAELIKSSRVDFADPSGQMIVSTWDSPAAMATNSKAVGDQLVCVTNGSMNFTDKAGHTLQIESGEAAYIRHGSDYVWQVPEYVRAVSSVFAPKQAAAPAGGTE